MSEHQFTDHRATGILEILGVLNILFGIGAVLLKLLVGAAISFSGYHLSHFQIILTIVGFILHALLIIGGIGLLRLRSWGRVLSISIAVTYVVSIILSLSRPVRVALPLLDILIGSAEWIEGFWGVMIRLVLLVYPVLLIILLNRAAIRAQFKPQYSFGLGEGKEVISPKWLWTTWISAALCILAAWLLGAVCYGSAFDGTNGADRLWADMGRIVAPFLAVSGIAIAIFLFMRNVWFWKMAVLVLILSICGMAILASIGVLMMKEAGQYDKLGLLAAFIIGTAFPALGGMLCMFALVSIRRTRR